MKRGFLPEPLDIVPMCNSTRHTVTTLAGSVSRRLESTLHRATEGTPMKNAIAAFALLAAACGGDTAETTTTTAPTTTTAAATTTAPTTTTPATTTTVETTTTVAGPAILLGVTNHGEVLVDDQGITLYLFLPDDQGPSACTGGCATTWPPLVGEFGAGAGVDADLLGTVARGDGSLQVTYNGWPLYHYSGDGESGDTFGQALGGNWWVVDAAGEPVM